MNGETIYKVYNTRKYDIGVNLLNGSAKNIKAGNFTMMTADDIMYIDGLCTPGFFSSKKLEARDSQNKPVPLDVFMLDEAEERSLSEEEVIQQLKQPVKKLEAWLNGIEDRTELHGIYEIAKTLDLPASKLKVLNQKMPQKDWLDERSVEV